MRYKGVEEPPPSRNPVNVGHDDLGNYTVDFPECSLNASSGGGSFAMR